MSYQCQPDTSSNSINAKPIGAISAHMFQQEHFSLGRNQIGVLYQLLYEVYMLQVKVDLITIPMSLSISHD